MNIYMYWNNDSLHQAIKELYTSKVTLWDNKWHRGVRGATLSYYWIKTCTTHVSSLLNIIYTINLYNTDASNTKDTNIIKYPHHE